MIYGDGLATWWDDWPWDRPVNFANSSPLYSGTYSLAATHTAARGALRLNWYIAIFSADYDALQFWINGGSQGGQTLRAMLVDGNHNLIEPGVEIQALAGWHQIRIPLTDLGNPAIIRGIAWQDKTGGAADILSGSDIACLGCPSPERTRTRLDIDADAGRHALSEDIYGMNLQTKVPRRN